jgi:hypothetical protein
MKYLTRVSILYLVFPFILFAFGWLRLSVAVPVVLLILWATWKFFAESPIHYSLFPTPKTTFYLLLITFLWLLLSGIGGYAFQNWDHHWRNAVLRDLIAYDFPVIYSAPEKGAIQMLVYYVGYFLPAAWVGKLLGWQAANFALFAWTWLGVLLVTLQLGNALKTSAVKVAPLLILFSGLDSLGAILFASDYPTLFPPIQHLEIWSGNLQYSSFTTQLFWVFNQAIPAWLCIVLLADNNFPFPINYSPIPYSPISYKLFTYSLCLFFAPLAALGLFPYLIIELIQHTDFKSPFKNLARHFKEFLAANFTDSRGFFFSIREYSRNSRQEKNGWVVVKNLRLDVLLASGIIVIISFLYFSSNTAAQERGFQSIALKDFLAFFLLEGGILWLVLAPLKWRDPRWAVTGLLLAIIPFVQLGSGRDFVMRASIAPLFYLMMMTGEAIFHKSTPRSLLVTLYLLLALGSFTTLYEINRSVYRTVQYYSLEPTQRAQPTSGVVTHLPQPGIPESEHPNALVADDIRTLKFMEDKLSKNFIANVRQSLYYRYLSSR